MEYERLIKKFHDGIFHKLPSMGWENIFGIRLAKAVPEIKAFVETYDRKLIKDIAKAIQDGKIFATLEQSKFEFLCSYESEIDPEDHSWTKCRLLEIVKDIALDTELKRKREGKDKSTYAPISSHLFEKVFQSIEEINTFITSGGLSRELKRERERFTKYYENHKYLVDFFCLNKINELSSEVMNNSDNHMLLRDIDIHIGFAESDKHIIEKIDNVIAGINF